MRYGGIRLTVRNSVNGVERLRYEMDSLRGNKPANGMEQLRYGGFGLTVRSSVYDVERLRYEMTSLRGTEFG